MSRAKIVIWSALGLILLLLTQDGIGNGLAAIPLVGTGMYLIMILNFGCRIPWKGGREWKP